MEQTVSRFRDDDLSPYRVFSEDQWARLRADTPMTLTASEVARLQSLNDPVSIAQVESILLPLSRLLAYYVEATQQLHRATNRFLGLQRGEKPLRHRPRRIRGGGQVHNRPPAPGASGTLAGKPQGRSGHHGRLPASQRGAGAGRPDAAQGLSRKLRSHDAAHLPLGPEGRAQACARAGLLPLLLRRDAGPVCHRRPAGHPHSRGAERAADLQSAARRQGGALRFRLLRLLDLHRCGRGRAARVVREALHAPARDRIPRPRLLLQQVFDGGRERGAGDRRGPVARDQPGQPAGKHPADPPARRP